MNVPRVLALSVTAVACLVLFLVMRYPKLRRPQFQDGRSFSIGISLACSLGVFLAFAWVIVRLQP